MNLTDLRAELNARADSADSATDLLPGVRRKITRTKRRRTAIASGAIACVAVVAAITTGVVPGLSKTSEPAPAKDVPADVFQNGVTLPGMIKSDRMVAAEVGKMGENPIELRLNPPTSAVAVYTYCRVYSHPTTVSLAISLNGRRLFDVPCHDADTTLDPQNRSEIASDVPEWIVVAPGEASRLTAVALDSDDNVIKNGELQTGIGVYSTPVGTSSDGLPRRQPLTGADDYTKAGYRYRAKVGDNELLGATIGDLGRTTVKVTVTGTGRPLAFQQLCVANLEGKDGEPFRLSFTIPGLAKHSSICWTSTTDLGNGDPIALPAGQTIPDGQTVEVAVTLEDSKGRLVSDPSARIGLGIYQTGSQRTVDGGAGSSSYTFPEIIEKGGFVYQLTDIKSVDAKLRTLELPTPAGRPFLVRYGSTGLSDTEEVLGELTGVDARVTYSENAGGLGGSITVGSPARGPGTAYFSLTMGTPTKGKIFLAIYTPVPDDRPSASPTK